MSKADEIEELDEDNVEVEESIEFNLMWTCDKCGKDNVEYNITPFEENLCKCQHCGKKYTYYYQPY